MPFASPSQLMMRNLLESGSRRAANRYFTGNGRAFCVFVSFYTTIYSRKVVLIDICKSERK